VPANCCRLLGSQLVAVADWHGGKPGDGVSLREGAGDVVGVCPASLDAPVPHAAEAIAKRASRASSAYFMDEKTALQLSRLQSNVAAGVCGRSSYHATSG